MIYNSKYIQKVNVGLNVRSGDNSNANRGEGAGGEGKSSRFESAIVDFRYLRGRGYAPRASLKIVGDHYQLTRLERNVLFRGVFAEEAAQRAAKLVSVPRVTGATLAVDWYNVLITVESYLKGRVLFLADDGVVRDAAAVHGSYRRHAVTPRALESIVAGLREVRPQKVCFYLDAPVSQSALMARELALLERQIGAPVEAHLAASADQPLKQHDDVVASSDSIVLDHAPAIFDLAAHVLESSFGFRPPPVGEVFSYR
jgi:hypothetical protein